MTTLTQVVNRGIRGLLTAAWSVRPATRANRILYYHSIHPTLPHSTTPADFEWHLRYLLESGYRVITHREVPAALREPGGAPWVVIGFDDGYADNYEIAAPIMAKYGVKGTFYVVAGQVGIDNRRPDSGYHLFEDRAMLSIDQIRRLADEGHEIASHGLTHELATAVLRQGRDLTEELLTSRHLLGKWAGQDVVSYSYPNGQTGAHSKATRACVAAAGFESGAGTWWGTVTPDCDLTLLPRCEISPRDTPAQFRLKLTGRADYLWLAHRIRRSPTW